MSPAVLPYAAIDAAWAERQLAVFHALSPSPPADALPSFLLGRLLADDLRFSCRPTLPGDVGSLHGVTLQGTCILQVVDVVNIGANYEGRTEDTKGPTRTLKLCLTDGHQLVFGFEFVWLPQFSVQTLRGSKIAVQNVDIRHGMLLLTPKNCQLLGTSAEMAAQHQKDAMMSLTQDVGAIRASGAYAAAIATAQFGSASASMNKTAIVENSATSSGIATNLAAISRAVPAQLPRTTPTASAPAVQTPRAQQQNIPVQPPHSRLNESTSQLPPKSAKRPQEKPPPVFVDVISSDEEFGSDTTDPMVEHLFYSPNTPRLPSTDRTQQQPQPHASTSSETGFNSRKRQRTPAVPTPSSRQQAPSNEIIMIDDTPTSSPPPPPPRRQVPRVVDPSQPFQYFSATQGHPHLAALRPQNDQPLVEVRAFVKSVAGFQFQTGEYHLRVLVEDCTQVHEVSVDPAFVSNLMGVPCGEFNRAMQQTPSIAHRWAARMQFALMTLEGIMSFRVDRKSSSETAMTLMSVRETTQEDAWKLLARIRQTT